MPALTETVFLCLMLLLVAYEDRELGGSARSPGGGLFGAGLGSYNVLRGYECVTLFLHGIFLSTWVLRAVALLGLSQMQSRDPAVLRCSSLVGSLCCGLGIGFDHPSTSLKDCGTKKITGSLYGRESLGLEA